MWAQVISEIRYSPTLVTVVTTVQVVSIAVSVGSGVIVAHTVLVIVVTPGGNVVSVSLKEVDRDVDVIVVNSVAVGDVTHAMVDD